MSQPVKLSDALVLDARLAGEAQERSIAGQVEFWAKLGRSVDLLLKGQQVLALRRIGESESLSERLASVDSPAGRERVEAYLHTRPYPHYKEHGQPGLLIRIDEDGAQTVGRFVNRVFVPVEVARESALSGTRKSQIVGQVSNSENANATGQIAPKPNKAKSNLVASPLKPQIPSRAKQGIA